MMTALLPYVPAVLAWGAVLYELPTVRPSPHNATRRPFWVALLFLALALTVLLPSVAVVLDQVTHVGNLSRLLGNGLVLVAAWAVQAYLWRLNYPDQRAQRGIQFRGPLLIAALALMTALFLRAPVHREVADFWQRYGNDPYILIYRLIFVIYLGVALFNVFRLSWRYADIANTPQLSLGLRLIAVGAIVGLVYCLHESLHVLSLTLGLRNSVLDSNLVTQLLIAVSIGLLVIGCTMPAWGARLGIPQLCRWTAYYSAYRRLYPLWRVLYQANPEIALFPPRSRLGDVLTVSDLRLRLHRRVIEIRDGRLALRPYLDPAVTLKAEQLCRKAGLPAEETQAVVEAVELAAAIEAKRQGRMSGIIAVSSSTIGGTDLESEVEDLVRVARCYQRSPIVHNVVHDEKRRKTRKLPGVNHEAGRPG